MTIKEAIKKWNTTDKTMIKYLSEGYIDGVTITDNVVYIPDIGQPLNIGNVKFTCGKIYYYILKALDDQRYINSNMLKITEEQFELFLSALESSGYISVSTESKPKNSILRYYITPEGVNLIKRCKNEISIKKSGLIEINFNLNLNAMKIL